ncbi:helix-turn-helix transcriptional regulator [Streptomyces sp. NPDC126514]|uniref:helix-turn-helix domain-containing protein n=1 Tax=Streptomyces sp. NPDC126514 TaxID=3155210 RepID=UPI00332B3018
MSEGTAGEGFAASLRELKDRSGLSYGVLAKRLHMSTSTLHRYCNGDAVPVDYAPVERLARLCKASPEELVELHRRWVLADAGRGRKTADQAPAPEAVPAPAPVDPTPAPTPTPTPSPSSPRRRTALLAAITVAAVLGGVALAVNPLSDEGRGSDDARRGPVGAAASDAGPAPSAKPSPADSPSNSPSKEARRTTPPASPSTGRTGGGGGADSARESGTEPLLTVNTRPYTWEDPCSQHYLIDREPAKVPPPPFQQGAPAWVDAVGAVSAGEQLVTVTVQGTGEETVVLESLTARVVSKDTPLAWNDYTMGVGCGGDVPTRPFTVALDAARPVVVAAAGQRDLPFKVSESDPEVFRITADASAYDVRWYLELAWSSGDRNGTLVVDDGGEPFRTSGNNGRPAYEFPPGAEEWIPAGKEGS